MGGSFSTAAASTTSSSGTASETPLKPGDDSTGVVKFDEPTVAEPDMSSKSVETETKPDDEKTQTQTRLERLKTSYQKLRPVSDVVVHSSPAKDWDAVVENAVRVMRSDQEFWGDDEWLNTSHLPKLNREAVFPDHFYKPLTDFALSVYAKPDAFFLPPDALLLEYWLLRYMAYKYRDTYRYPVKDMESDLTCLYAAVRRVWLNFDTYEKSELSGRQQYQLDHTLELSCPNKIKVFSVFFHELPGGFGHM